MNHRGLRNSIRVKPKQKRVRQYPAHRAGVILLIVFMVVTAVSLGALAYSRSMLTSHQESVLLGESIQARYAADSALDAARLFVAASRVKRAENGGTYNNPSTFQAIPVLQGRGDGNILNYSIVSPDLDEMGRFSGIRFGLLNESAKLNLNVLPIVDSQMSIGQIMQQSMPGISALGLGGSGGGPSGPSGGSLRRSDGTGGAGGTGGSRGAGGAPVSGGMGQSSGGSGIGRALLMGLPSMTEDIADAILDFIDEDDDPREYGAERDYYANLATPYAPLNGPLQSIEQLLLVRGITPDLLFGFDQNRNGVLDSSEQSAAVSLGVGTQAIAERDRFPELGWSAYVTIFSKERNVQENGNPRININSTDIATLQSDLESAVGADLATFIIAYRYMANSQGGGQAGPGGGGPGGGGQGGQRGRGDGDGDDGPGGTGPGGGPRGGGPGGGGRNQGDRQGEDGGRFRNGPGRDRNAPGNRNFPGGNNGNFPGGGNFQGPNGPGGDRPNRPFPRQNRGRSSAWQFQAPEQFLNTSLSLISFLQPPDRGGNAGGRGDAGRRGDGRRGDGGGDARGGNTRGGDNRRGDGRGNDRNGPGAGSGGGFGGIPDGGGATKTVIWNASMLSGLNIDSSQPPNGNIRQVLDLIGAQFTADINGERVTIRSPLDPNPVGMALYLPMIMDKLTAVSATVMPGRININEAPREILAGLPGMTEEILDALIESRVTGAENENRKFETWPMVEGILTLDQMKLIAPLVTGGGDCMRAQCIGYFEQSAGFSRLEAVIDGSGQVPTVVLYRKLDHLGRGFGQATLGQRGQLGVAK